MPDSDRHFRLPRTPLRWPFGSGKWPGKLYLMVVPILLVLAIAVFAETYVLLSRHDNILEVVNVSGRQRMLSQRIALMVSRLDRPQSSAQRTATAEALRLAAAQLQQSHHLLTTEVGLMSPQENEMFRQMYFEGDVPVDRLVHQYLSATHNILAAAAAAEPPDPELVRFIAEIGPGPLLDALDDMVNTYQKEGEIAIGQLHQRVAALLALCLFGLLTGMTILLPVLRGFRSKLEGMEQIRQELQQARDNLEQEISARTAELRQAKQAAEQASLAKSRFLAATGHDLKQPLEAIAMFGGMIRRKVDDSKLASLVDDLITAQRSMRLLLDSILEISKLEAGVIAPKFEVLSLHRMLQYLEAEFSPLFLAKGLHLSVVPASVEVVSDPLLLGRVLRNLLSNALRYTRRGRVLIGCRRRPQHLDIMVYDTGVGIPQDQLKTIFQEFKQLDDPDRDRGQGIGLGLAIVERIARLLHCRLDVHSQEGKGSVFVLSIPHDLADRVKLVAKDSSPDTTTAQPAP